MNLSKLEKASKIFDQIKTLDKEINEIDKIAMMIATGETKSCFELKVQDLKPDKEKQKNDLFDQDGSLKNQEQSLSSLYDSMRMLAWPSLSLSGNRVVETKENETTLNPQLSETATLQILGIILCDKQLVRRTLINQLERLGVQV